MSATPLSNVRWQVVSPLLVPDWDQRLSVFSEAGVFHGAGWTRTLVETYGHHPNFLVWPCATGFAAVLPLAEVRGLLGGRSGFSLPFADSCPPLVAAGAPVRLAEMVDAAIAHGRAVGWKTVELRCQAPGVRPQSSASFYVHQLDLSPGESALFNGCHASTQRAVRRARSEGLKVEFVSGVPAVRDYYDLHCLTRKRHGLPPQPWRFFHALARNLVDGDRGFIARVRLDSRTIAAAVFLTCGRRALYKFGASDHRHQLLRANNLVMWESISRLAGSGFRTLEFGRTSLDNDGLRRFKLGWGAAESSLHYYRLRCVDGSLIPLGDRSSGWHTTVIRRLPICLSRLLGNLLYRYQA